jgi:high-affinity Fe2+/Pb2+ permease
MKELINFVIENQETIFGLVAIVVSLVYMGRKRAVKLVHQYLDSSKEDFLKNIEQHAPAFAKYIYAKLPKTARLFLTAKRIEKLIIKFAKQIQDLDI